MSFNTYTVRAGVTRITASWLNSYIRDSMHDIDDRLSLIFRRDGPNTVGGVGMLVPMTTAERDVVLAPIAGMGVWNTTTGQAEIYNGTAWVKAGGDTLGWNALTTSDSVPLGMFLKTTGLEGWSLTTLNDELLGAYPNAETDTDKTWHPDGAGGAEWRVPVHAHSQTWDTPGDHDWDLPSTANWVAFVCLGAGGGGGGGRSPQTSANGAYPGGGGGGGARGQFKSKSETAYASNRHFRIHIGTGGAGGFDANGSAGASTWVRVRRPADNTLFGTVMSSVGGAAGRKGVGGYGGVPGSTYDSQGGRGSSNETGLPLAGDDAAGGGGGGFYWFHPGGADIASFLARAHAGAAGGGAYTYLSGISLGTGASGGGIGGSSSYGLSGSNGVVMGHLFGTGGGGGGGSEGSGGGRGGNGVHGSGGGGGGGAPWGSTGAAGGNGGNGVFRAIWW